MRRPLRLLNLLLGLVALLMAIVLIRTWVAPIASTTLSPTVTKPAHEAEALAYNPPSRPPVNQFDVLLDKNPFKQPPPMPVQPSAVAPPPPLPTLVGTILVDQQRQAILSDKGKSNIYSMGQGVAGGVITEIKEDRILFKRGDTTQEIMLKAAIESGAAPPARTEVPAIGQAGVAGSSIEPGQAARRAARAEAEAARAELRRRQVEGR